MCRPSEVQSHELPGEDTPIDCTELKYIIFKNEIAYQSIICWHSSLMQNIMEEIPAAMRDKLLPSEGMNIPSLLQFRIPTILAALSAVDPQGYFSQEEHTTALGESDSGLPTGFTG